MEPAIENARSTAPVDCVVMRLDDFTESRRASGRTTRMLAEAKRLAKEGKAVYVIATHHQQLQRQIDSEYPNSGIKCEPHVPLGFDWRAMRVHGSHPNCVWLFDHYAIEADCVFVAMFEAMTRFDA